MDAAGHLSRRGDAETAPYVYTGIQMLHPRLFEGCAIESFSLNKLYDKALTGRRLFGLAHDGMWHDVGNPENRDHAEQVLMGLES